MDSSPSPEWVLLFDGPCALCQGAVRWLMRRDRGKLLRYSPLQGDWAQEWKRRYAPEDVWSDEVILVAGEQHWIGADAIGTCLRILPFPYPVLGWIYAHLPGRKKNIPVACAAPVYLVWEKRRTPYNVPSTAFMARTASALLLKAACSSSLSL